jgi:F420-non-reducing hydrogenase iron-sulfur subunit
MAETLATKTKPKVTNNEQRTTNNAFEPLIVVFCCNWCSYSGADLAGTSRIQYPSNIRIIRVMCSGMVHPKLVLQALNKGADGVMILGCHPGDCHYLDGNIRTQSRKEAIDLLLDDADIDRKRFRLEWVSASEGPRFAQVIKEMVDQVKEVGPNKPA